MDIASVSNTGQTHPAASVAQNSNWLTENRDLVQTVKQANTSQVLGEDNEMTFAVDQETRRPVVRIISRQTQQVIMQIPPEYMLRLAQTLDSSQDTYHAGSSSVAQSSQSGTNTVP